MKSSIAATLAALAAISVIACAGCARESKPTVVVYTALDRMYSEPILKEFERRSGIKVLAKYDSESTKTVGLVNTIRAEKDRPRCDVFWNNEIVNTVRLKNEGLLESFRPASAAPFPAEFKDADGFWHGFAARARVLLVNTNLVKETEMPASVQSLADPRWKGKTGIAKPLFGTTATHAACLYASLGDGKTRDFFASLKTNAICIESANSTVAMNVANGKLAYGLTDTDDAMEQIGSGRPVAIVYPDSKPDQAGTLFIPNTLALIKQAPNAESGKKLIEYLLSAEVEIQLAKCPSAQIPLNPEVKVPFRVKTPADIKAMPVDFTKAAGQFDAAATFIETYFLR